MIHCHPARYLKFLYIRMITTPQCLCQLKKMIEDKSGFPESDRGHSCTKVSALCKKIEDVC